MPQVRPWVDFHTTITDDPVEDHGYTVREMGKNLVWAVREFFEDLDCFVSPPGRLNEQMWHILVMFRGRPTHFSFSYRGNDVRVFCHPPKGLKRYFNDDYRYYSLLVTHLGERLGADPRFQNVQWRFAKDLKKGVPGPNWSASP